MPEDIDDDQEPEGTDLVPRQHIRELEAAAKEGREAKARLAEVERENAFARALGTATTEPWFSYFQKGYEGDLSVEAIRQAATDAGFAKASAETEAAPPPPNANPADLAAHQRMAAASTGAAPPPPFDPFAEIANAKSGEEIVAIIARADPDKYGVIGPQIQ